LLFSLFLPEIISERIAFSVGILGWSRFSEQNNSGEFAVSVLFRVAKGAKSKCR